MMDTFEYYNMKVPSDVPFFIIRPEPTFVEKIKLKKDNFEIYEKPEKVGYQLSSMDGIYAVETLNPKKMKRNWLKDHLKLMDSNPSEDNTTSQAYVESFCNRTAFLKRTKKCEFYAQDVNGS